MNDGQVRCDHGHHATLKPLSRYTKYAQPYAKDCTLCDGKPCGEPRITHPRPQAREHSDEKERAPALHHVMSAA